jgi:phospholipid N-methyltransferase
MLMSDKSTAGLRPQPDNRLKFFQGFLRRPLEVGSIIPSSRFLERRVARAASLSSARTVVELGPGTGGTTRAFLRDMPGTSKLLAIEINPDFIPVLDRLTKDQRLIVHEGSATDLQSALEQHDLPAPDVVLSGIPFSTMPREIGLEIIHSVKEALPVGGLFVAYQVRDRVEVLGNEVFGRSSKQTELRNVPPMRVYRWEKR